MSSQQLALNAAPVPSYMDEAIWTVDKVPGIYMIKDDDITGPLIFIFSGSVFIIVLTIIFLSGEEKISLGMFIGLVAVFSAFPMFGLLQKSTDFIFNDKSQMFVIRTKRSVSGNLVSNRIYEYRDIHSFECELDSSIKVNRVPSGKMFINILKESDQIESIQISSDYVAYPKAQQRINQMNTHLKVITKNRI